MSTKASPYFLNLKSVFCDNMNQYAFIKHYTTNEVLYQQGDVPFNLYIFISGQLKILNKTQQMMHCSVGEFIGAHANFANICYPETVKFLSAGQILVIQFDYFKERIVHYPILFGKIIEGLLQKQKIITNISDQQFSHVLINSYPTKSGRL